MGERAAEGFIPDIGLRRLGERALSFPVTQEEVPDMKPIDFYLARVLEGLRPDGVDERVEGSDRPSDG